MRLALSILFAVTAVSAQTPVPPLAFDAVSIHELTPPCQRLKMLKVSGTLVTLEGYGQAAPSTTDLRAMLRNLLAGRFHLTIHREMRNIPVYALVVDKNGPKLKPGTGGDDCASLIGPGTLPADRPVLDKTGLTGRYDISIFVTPEFRMRGTTEPDDIRFADAIRQLGLRLDAQNALSKWL